MEIFGVGALWKASRSQTEECFFEQLVFMEISRGRREAEVRFWTSLELLH